MTLSSLPDSTVVYVPEVGLTTTLGEIRAPEEEPALDEREATIRMWVDIGTRNLCRKPWQQPVSVSAIKAYHASRYTAATTRRGST